MNYYYAAAFLPKDLRPAAYAIYAFLRVPDKIADNDFPLNVSTDSFEQGLRHWFYKWRSAYWELGSEEAVLEAAAWVFRRYGIPYQHSEDFFNALLLDARKPAYGNYLELKSYLRGSSALAGIMLAHLIGFSDPRALEFAGLLGEATRLTCILRDIEKDYRLRARIYLPRDELSAYGLSEEDIKFKKMSPRFREFMRFQAGRAEEMYIQGQDGVNLLHKRGRFAVRVLLAFNLRVLEKMKAGRYDVFSPRAGSGRMERASLVIRTALHPRTEAPCLY